MQLCPKKPYFCFFEHLEDFVCKFAILRAILVKIFDSWARGKKRDEKSGDVDMEKVVNVC